MSRHRTKDRSTPPRAGGSTVRVLHLITDLDVGGAESLLCDLLPRLDRSRFEARVACLRGEAPLAGRLEAHGIPCQALDQGSPFSPTLIRRLATLLVEEEIDLLHTHLPRADWAGAFAFARARRRERPGLRLVQTRHNTQHFRGMRRLLVAVDRFAARSASRILAVSRAVAKEARELTGLPASRVLVVPNSVDPERFAEPADSAALRDALDLAEAFPILLLVGSLTPQKGIDIALEALVRIKGAFEHARLLVAGSGPLHEQLVSLARSLGVAREARLLGTRHDIPRLLALADVVLQPSRWEGFGIAALEAMAAGAPLVASRVDGLEELVTHGQTGILVPPDDADALARAVLAVLESPDATRDRADRARRRARERYSIETTARSHERIYEEVLEEGFPGSGKAGSSAES